MLMSEVYAFVLYLTRLLRHVSYGERLVATFEFDAAEVEVPCIRGKEQLMYTPYHKAPYVLLLIKQWLDENLHIAG
jgi:hypothetical protein